MVDLVLDSSIALAWCMPDEDAPEADEIQARVARHGACAAAHWPLEVANALLMAVRRGRIDERFRDSSLRDLATLPITLDPETGARAWREITGFADRYRLTIYDAAYLELAHRRALPLATLDTQLRAAAGASGVTLVGA